METTEYIEKGPTHGSTLINQIIPRIGNRKRRPGTGFFFGLLDCRISSIVFSPTSLKHSSNTVPFAGDGTVCICRNSNVDTRWRLKDGVFPIPLAQGIQRNTDFGSVGLSKNDLIGKCSNMLCLDEASVVPPLGGFYRFQQTKPPKAGTTNFLKALPTRKRHSGAPALYEKFYF